MKRPTAVHGLTFAFLAATLACHADAAGPSPGTPEGPAFTVVSGPDTLAPSADTYIASDVPNKNYGAIDSMESRSYSDGNKHAILIAFDQTAIASAVGSGTLDSAFLELPVRHVANWPSGGGVLWLNRMLQDWTETGATAACAIDNNTGNNTPDCPSTAWDPDLHNRMITTPTDSARIYNSTTGWTRLRVTPDVQAWLGGAPNHGWGFGNLSTNNVASIWWGTREAATKPRLVLWVTPLDNTKPEIPSNWWPDDSNYTVTSPAPEDSGIVVMYRRLIDVRFADSTSGSTIRSFLAKYQATIVGGIPLTKSYAVQVPDPGATWTDYTGLLDRMEAEPGVLWAGPLTRRGH
jgi:hypothetical protein